MEIYLYNDLHLKELKDNYSEYIFIDMYDFCFNYREFNDLENVNKENYRHHIIDISNVIQEENGSKIYIYKCLKIFEKIEDLLIIMNSFILNKFKSEYPLYSLFCTYNETFNGKEIDVDKLKIIAYDNNNTNIFNESISIAKVFEICEKTSADNLILTLVSELNSKKIKYIDITTLISTIKYKNDLILENEKILLKLAPIMNIEYCVENELYEDVKKFFPNTFSFVENTTLLEHSTCDPQIINIKDEDKKLDLVMNKLKGHDKFKQDFKDSYKMFKLYNNIGENKIMSIFLFGQPGIGKTEFAKILSNVFYPDEKLIKINFGNYTNEGMLNSLIGSPLGYIGSLEGGELINKIKLSKSKIILIDEFEKADSQVHNFFYELLEDGKFTDRHGDVHDLNDYIIIFTSNLDKETYNKKIPNPLKSRFDLVYNFTSLSREDKINYIYEVTNDLINKIHNKFGIKLDISLIQEDLDALVNLEDLRYIKRIIKEVIMQFYMKHKY